MYIFGMLLSSYQHFCLFYSTSYKMKFKKYKLNNAEICLGIGITNLEHLYRYSLTNLIIFFIVIYLLYSVFCESKKNFIYKFMAIATLFIVIVLMYLELG